MDVFCRNLSVSSSSTSGTGGEKIVNNEEIIIQDFEKIIDNWKIPKVQKDQIYKQSKFNILQKSDYTIKTKERNINLTKPYETIKLLSHSSLNKHKERKYNYIHIGLVQVGIKPLTKEGLNTSILTILRDARFYDFQDSLLSSVESSLCSGPISFDCYPNLTISLQDKNILDSLTLQVKTHNYKMNSGSIPVALIYKVHYKAMISAFSSKALLHSKKGETLLLQTDLSKANAVVPRNIRWSDITLPTDWILEGANKPQAQKAIEPNNQLENIIQYPDGKVKLTFARHSTSARFSNDSSSSSHTIDLGRISQLPSVINVESNRHSISEIPVQIQTVDHTNTIPHPTYTSQPEPEQSPPTSPGFSALDAEIENELSTIEKPFEINKTYLHNEFYSEKNKEKKIWFFKNFLEIRKQIQEEYYDYMKENEINIEFFTWFEIYYAPKNDIEYPFKMINNSTKTKIWETKTGQKFESEHPPLRELEINHFNKTVTISPYKTKNETEDITSKDIKNIIEQNNFTNTHLQTIGTQLNKISNIINKPTI